MRSLASCVLLVALVQSENTPSTPSGTKPLLSLGRVGRAETAKRMPTRELTIEQGMIRGEVLGDERDIHAYKGIPFAAPPVGEGRWRAPAPWEGIRDCFEFGPGCPQKSSPWMALIPLAAIGGMSEDCLTLNVYRSAAPSPEARPVMVWIHGGAYTEGAGSQGIYDGAALARKGVVVVTINYRLGPLGFMAHPALSAESPENASGNYGLLDQIEALRWVKRNIAAFGGDPGRVTIFGESAGGGSVLCLLVSPLAKGLFQRAIAQSAPEMTFLQLTRAGAGRESAEQQGQSLVARCGVSATADAAALRAIEVDRLVQVSPTLALPKREPSIAAVHLPMGPVVDGHVLLEDPNVAFAAGRVHPVPLLIGHTRDEFTLFLMMIQVPKDEVGYRRVLAREFGEQSERILALYPPGASAKAIRAASVQLMTDLVYGTQTRHCAQWHAARGQATYKFLFARENPMALPFAAGAHHGCDVPYVFGLDNATWREWDRELAEITMRYWVNFATSGNPNGAGLPAWPAYDLATRRTLELGDRVTVLADYRKEHLDLLDEFWAEHRESTPSPVGGQ